MEQAFLELEEMLTHLPVASLMTVLGSLEAGSNSPGDKRDRSKKFYQAMMVALNPAMAVTPRITLMLEHQIGKTTILG